MNATISAQSYHYRLACLKRGMELELATGMKLTRANTFQIVRNDFGIRKRRKQDVYDEFMKITGGDMVTYVNQLAKEQNV